MRSSLFGEAATCLRPPKSWSGDPRLQRVEMEVRINP
jgi:hypothetical protein